MISNVLDTLASQIVGDGRSPNVYFVTVADHVQAVLVVGSAEDDDDVLRRAIAHAETWPSTVPAFVEDRKTGVCWDNPASEAIQRADDEVTP